MGRCTESTAHFIATLFDLNKYEMRILTLHQFYKQSFGGVVSQRGEDLPGSPVGGLVSWERWTL